jgi:hypothetical protein
MTHAPGSVHGEECFSVTRKSRNSLFAAFVRASLRPPAVSLLLELKRRKKEETSQRRKKEEKRIKRSSAQVLAREPFT